MNATRRMGVPHRSHGSLLAAVGVQRAVEVARLAVDVDVERVERRAALAQRRASSRRGRARAARATWAPGQPVARPVAVDPGPPERLVGVDVADAGDQALVEQLALDPGRYGAAPGRRSRRRRTAGRAGRGRCGRSRAAGRRRRRRPSRPPNIRWSTNRSSTAGVSRASRTRRCRSSGAPGGWTSIWPLMPRWPSRASPLSSGSQKYLPRRRAPSIRRPVRAAAKPSGSARVAAYRARVQHLDAGDGAPDHVALEAGADDLDLGELGHVLVGRRSSAAARPRLRLGRAGSVTPRLGAISPYAVSAAACSASFLERPTPLP